MVPAISLRCCCSTELARTGSWQNPSLKPSHIRRRSSSTCPGSVALPCRPFPTGHRRWRGLRPVWLPSSATASAMRGARNLGYFYQLLAMTGWTSLPWLWSLPQPTLILMGSDDPLVPPINGRVLALLIPNAELRMIDDGHLFMVTRPAETARLIEEFLAEGKNEAAQRSSLLSRAVGWRRRFLSASGGPHP